MLNLVPGKFYDFRFIQKYDEYRCFDQYFCEINYKQKEFESDFIYISPSFLNKTFRAMFLGNKKYDLTDTLDYWLLLPISTNKIIQVEIAVPNYIKNTNNKTNIVPVF